MNELVNRIGGPRLIQASIDLWNSLFLLIIAFLVLNSYRRERKQRSICKPVPLTMELLVLCIVVFIYNLFDSISLLFNGYTGTDGRFWKSLGEYGYFFTGIILLLFLLDIIKKCINSIDSNRKMCNVIKAVQSLQALNLIMLVTNPFTDRLFLIDSSNYYSRGMPFYYVWSGINIFSLAVSIVICAIYFRRMSFFKKRIVCVTVGITFVTCICNLFFYTLSLHCICVSLITFYLFVIYSKNRTDIIIKDTVKIEKLKTDLVLSQISPHFIQNSITAIIYYADKDTAKTRSALIDFSKYLRKNIDYTNLNELVTIEEEIEHVKIYLSLEELRFGDDLSVEFDLKAGSFRLPALTVQPMVENAVKHGIKNSESGCGTVTVCTDETEDNYIIKIKDDGAGFDTDILESIDTTHTGIRSVKSRLMLFCGGSLVLESKIGEGTVCTITIPKSEDRNENTDNG
ncbi:MAG: histidine kinase [Ruminococcus sp.]|nr:histidine kinase [Ruminococcus sp.]